MSDCNLNEQSQDSSLDFNLTTLFKLFTKDVNEQDEIKPSTYQKEVSLSLHERLKQLRNISRYHDFFNTSHGGDFFDCFDVDPSILVFQNWEVNKQYATSIIIRNKTKKVKFISLSVEDSEIFLITPKQVRKMSSLSSLVYKVKFLPVHLINYKIKMTINSDNSFYNFEIIALPPRPNINFPDIIDFGKILINFNSIKEVYLTNIGDAVGMAKISTDSKDIHIEPRYICMNANDMLNLEIKFHPSVLGRVKEKIIITYSTGEKLCVEIQAFVVNGNIFLNEEELVFKETFITFNELNSLVVYNKTEYPVNFQWCCNENEEIDLRPDSSKIFGLDVASDNKLERLNSESFLLSDHKSLVSMAQGVFSIMPMEGVIPMNDSFTFIAMFSPINVGKVESIFYLHIEGLENRLPVKITGIAVGPSIHLNVSTLDLNDIYVNEKYNYQIFAKNSSLVRGTLRLLPFSSFNNFITITVDFEEAVLNPSDIHIINISLASGVLGSFVIELRIEIIESKNIIKCILKGTVIEPVLKFNCSCIDFGTVPIGVRFEQVFTIANHSSIDVNLKLQIPLDGVEEAVVYNDIIRGTITGLLVRPNEFRLEPKDFTISGKSRIEIKIFLVANIAKKYIGDILISSTMHLYEEKKLPVCFVALAPEITCFENTMKFPYCFKGVEYEKSILLSNKDKVQVSFWLLDYKDEICHVYCHGKENEVGLIGPAESKEFTLQLSIGIIGEHTFTLLAYILGNGIIPLCDITIVGNGPVVLIEAMSLVWPHTEISNPYPKTFSMVNNSPIPAEFLISVEKDHRLWFISNYEGTIQPDDALDVTVTPNPIDIGILKDSIQIQIKHSRTLTVKLEAKVKGSSIKFSPNIFPIIDFGTALRIADNKNKILVSNIGSKAQLVILSIDETLTIKKLRTRGNPQGEIFRIVPSVFVLPEFSEMDLLVTIRCQSLGRQEEIIHCFTRFENKYKMTYLGSSIMRANFVDLNLNYDQSLLHFDVVSNINEDPKPKTRPFILHIDWENPVKVVMTVPQPFGIIKDNYVYQEEIFMVSVDNPLRIELYFDPMFVKDYKIRSYSRELSLFFVDYNYKKFCKISADVFFPNVSLSRSTINFECIELFHCGHKELIMKNNTPTEISYKWYWISVIPLRLDKYNLKDSSMEIVTIPSLQQNDLSERTRHSIKAFKTIESHRFSTFEDFENIARHFGLDIHPLVMERDSRHVNDYKVTSVDQECASLLEFSPFLGEIEAGGCKIMVVNFSPRYYLLFEAVAVCAVEGGPSEILVIKGCCSPVNFEIIPNDISFGFAPCCELCKTMFIIKNNCLKKLPYSVHTPELSSFDKNALDESCVWVEEDSGVVKPFSSVEVKLTVWFGTLGEIDITILIEINNKPMKIKISAFCCPNQVMISLPRKIPQLFEDYLVLASLREPWFFIPEFISKTEAGWENVTVPEMLPSDEDVHMGMERFFLHLLLRRNRSLFSEHFLAKKRTFTIKGFKAPSYFMDFGIVILGTKAEYKLEILNYYPREVVLKVIYRNLCHFKELEFHDKRSFIIVPPLGTAEISVSIFVTNMFEKSDININYNFSIEVLCGPTIPISLTATVSLPRLLLPDSVDFGTIKCNQMKIINIPIKNIGIIPCEWIVFVRDVKGRYHEVDNPKSYKQIPFIVQKSHGYTEPNLSDYIPIYFKPIKSGEYNMILEFVINMNPEKIVIPIKGVGLKPLIHVSNIDFGCVIPFCKPTIKTLEIKNLSSFPVEVFFPAYHDEINAKAMVLQTITRYYQQKIYVPMTDYEIIPYDKIYNIYRRICDEAIMFEKFSRLYNISEYYQVPSFGLRKSRSEMVFKRRYELNLRKCKSLPNLVKSETRYPSVMNVCYKKSPELILKEYFDYLDCGYKPIPAYLSMKGGNIYCSRPEPIESKIFTLIIVLGAPETDHIEWAAKLAKALGIVSVSLDEIIFQELGESDSKIAADTRTSIREIYIKEIIQDDCFEDPSKYPCSNYVELKTMVEELMSNCPSKLFEFCTAIIKFSGMKYTQQLPFCLTAQNLKDLISSRVSSYSSDLIIESIEGFFFSDIIIALSILVELFTDNMNLHIINLHSFPIWYLKCARLVVETEANDNFKDMMEYMTYLHGVEHAEILAKIPSFVKRYYYLFNIGEIEGTEDVFTNHPELIMDKPYKHSMKQNEDIISELDKISELNSLPFTQLIQKMCYEIITSEEPEIVWTRCFVSQPKLQSFLKEFLKYAHWFAALVPLWSSMRSSKSFRSSKMSNQSDRDTVSRGTNITKKSSRFSSSFKSVMKKHPDDVYPESRTTKKSSRLSRSFKSTEREHPCDLDTESRATKRSSRSTRSFKSITRKHPSDFDTESRSTKRSSRPTRSFESQLEEHPSDFETESRTTKRSSRPTRSFKSIMHEHPSDFNIESKTTKRFSRPTRSFKSIMHEHPSDFNIESKTTKWFSRPTRSFKSIMRERPSDFETESRTTKRSSRPTRSFKSIMHEHPSDFNIESKTTKRFSRPTRSFKSIMRERPSDFETESRTTKRYSRSTRSFKSIMRKHPRDSDTESRVNKRSSRPTRFLKSEMQEHTNDDTETRATQRSVKFPRFFKSQMQKHPNDFDRETGVSERWSSWSSISYEEKMQEQLNDFDITDSFSSEKSSTSSGSFEITVLKQELPNHVKPDSILSKISTISSVSSKKTIKKQSIHYDVNTEPRHRKSSSIQKVRGFSSEKKMIESPNDSVAITGPKPSSKKLSWSFRKFSSIDRPTHFDVKTGRRSSKFKSSRLSSIFLSKFKSREIPFDFDVLTESRATKVVNNYPDLPLWILCTEDLNFEKFIPLLCSKKTAFGIETPEPPPEKEKEDVIPEPRVYFRLESPKTIGHYERLTNFKIYNNINEASLLEMYNFKKSMNKKNSEIFDEQSIESNSSHEMRKISQYNSVLCSKRSQYDSLLCSKRSKHKRPLYSKSSQFNILLCSKKSLYDSLLCPKRSQYNSLLFSKQNIELPDLDFVTRKYLEPGEKASWNVVYSPVSCGISANILTVRTAGFNGVFKAHIEGICDIPTVSFEFNDLIHELPLNSEPFPNYKIGFSAEESLYYFQPALISTLKKQKNYNPAKEATFMLSNISSVPAKVLINCIKNEKFNVVPTELEITPNESAIITIFSSITSVGSFEDEIFLSTLNNPLPQIIKVCSEGVPAIIKFEPKKLKFRNVLLYQEKCCVFQITNLCYKPIYWEIASSDSLAPVIKCSKLSSTLEPYTREDVFVSYRPEKCHDIKKLIIKVADAETKELLRHKIYKLHLRATDVKVHINTNLKTQNYLEYGHIKALNKYISNVTLSKSDKKKVFFRARIAAYENQEGKKISDYITITSISEGFIHKDNVDLEVVLFCQNEVHFEKIEAIFIEIYSPFDSDLKIAEIPLIFSFQSHFPKYALYPGDCLDFGNVEIDTEKKLFLTLENIGNIDFNYSIKCLNALISREDSDSFSQDSPMFQDSNSNIIILPPLKIHKDTGKILPGKQEIYEVVCKPKTVEKIFYEILLTIPELPKNSRKISICFAGIVPVLNFDIESLFREFDIVNTRQELSDFPNDGCFVAVFIKTERTLYFRNVSLYQTVNIDLFIENKSLLCCNVSIIVNGEGFSVQPSTLYIKSYLKDIVTMTYSPERLGVHKGSVKISLDLPYSFKNSSFTFLVEGSSELPAISIYDYFSETDITNDTIKIGFTANTTPVRHLLRIENFGNVFSKTIIDVESATNVAVTMGLVSVQNTIGPDSECDTKSVTVYLHPKETAVMGCTLNPMGIGTYSVTLVAYTVLNPYEKHRVVLTGDAITMNILLDGLTLINYFQRLSSRTSCLSNFFSKYNMNFGLYESGMVKKIIFYIRNQSEYCWAFKFSNFEFVSFSPDSGFVKPHSRVKIESFLVTDDELNPRDEEGTLFLAKVTIIDESDYSEPSILWKVDHTRRFHSKRSVNKTVHGKMSLRSLPRTKTEHREMVQDVQTNTIIIHKIDNKIMLQAKSSPVETFLSLYGDDRSKFRSTVVKQCSEEILFLKNTSEASCHVMFQLEDISFRDIKDEWEFLDMIGFVKMPSHSLISNDPVDELHFFNMDCVFPDVCLKDVFRPLLVQEMLLPQSTIKAKFTFCPPKPGIYSANVRVIIDDTLLDFPQTPMSAIGYIPPIQIAFNNEVEKNEFELLGILSSVKCIKITAYEPKSFIRNKLIYVYNSSNSTISYNWYCKNNLSTIENSLTGFFCHQASGNLEKQSLLKLEIIFNPQDYGVYQSLWQLEIPDYNTGQEFLFIGETKIPDIIFEPYTMSLNPVFLDMKTVKKVKIHNKEKVSFKYKVDSISLYSDIESEKLYIDPPSGILEPNTTHEVTISSTLHVLRKYVYKTYWIFENVAKKFCFKVITQCLNVEVDVCCLFERNNINETISLKETESNFINIGKVSVNNVLDFIFIISNKGKVAISFEWIFSEEISNKLEIEINPYDDIIPAYTEFSSLMRVTVLEKINFRNIPFVLKVFKGPVYTLFLRASSEDPFYRLNFKKHDFGTCLVQTNDNLYNTVSLLFENLDKQMLQIEVKSPVVDYFKILLPCSNVPPESVVDIPIHFIPREKRKYKETIEFFINDTFTDAIVLLGEGDLFQVDVVKPSKGIIAIEKIGVNELIVEETQIINNSNTIFNMNLKIKNEYEKLIEIKLDPTDIELKPNALVNISVSLRSFSLGDYSGIEVWASCREYEMRLYCLTIHCVGAKLAFDREAINFFPHFRKQLQKEEVAIINSGNIPTRFKLDISDLPKIFKIEPLEGECLPGIPYILNISCCLMFISDYLSAKVKCLEEGKKEYTELTLTIYPFPPGVELKTLEFLCPVRQQNTQSISVKNGTQKPWSLVPLITGQYFSGEATLEVQPKTVEIYDVLYKPLTMTKGDVTHKGILVIPTQPIEMVVKLEGRSTEPLLEGELSLIVKAREKCGLKLTVENPLETLQKMSVRFRKNQSNTNIVNIDGSQCIILPPKNRKEYIMNFYAYKEGRVNFDVIFTNDETFEYMFYKITVEILPSTEIWETIEMNTMIENSISKTISIYNPLETKDTFKITSLVSSLDKYLTVKPYVLDVQPKQHGEFSIIYSPKKLEKKEVQLKATGDLLGTYFYKIILSSEPPISSNIISLSCPLGSKFKFFLKLPKPIVKEVPKPFRHEVRKEQTSTVLPKVFTMCHHVRVTVVIRTKIVTRHRKSVKEVPIFKAKSDNPEVTIKPIEQLSYIEELQCAYEPSSVGSGQAALTLEYFKPPQIFVYKLMCQCEPPQPQGPFDIFVSKPFVLRFKNVSDSKQTYSCSCVYDECCLKISNNLFTLKAREVIDIQISVSSDDKFKEHSTMLRITDLPKNLYRWDYYFNVH